MQKVTLTYKGKGSLTLNVPGYEPITLAEGKSHTFKTGQEYAPYAKVAIAWKAEGVLDIDVVDADAKAEVAPAKDKKAEAAAAKKLADDEAAAKAKVDEEAAAKAKEEADAKAADEAAKAKDTKKK